MARRIEASEIVLAVEMVSGISLRAVQSKSRMPAVLRARYTMLWLLRDYTDMTFEDIAELLRGSRSRHSTVIEAYHKIQKWMLRAKQGRTVAGRDPDWPGYRQQYAEALSLLISRKPEYEGEAYVRTAQFATSWLCDTMLMDGSGHVPNLSSRIAGDRIAVARAAITMPVLSAAESASDHPSDIASRIRSEMVAEEAQD